MRRLIFSLLFVFLCISFVFSEGKPRIAVIPLNAMGVSDIEAATATSLLGTALMQTDAFIIIEQNQVEKIIDAQSFTLSGNTDEFYATEIGKLLSAEQIIIGTFSQIGTEYILNVKIIDIEPGQNIRAEKVSFATIDMLKDSTDLLATKLAKTSPKKEEVSTNTTISEKQEPDITTSKSGRYIFQVGIGSAYSFYFPLIETTVDLMDADSLTRMPFSIDLLFGKKLSDTTAWTISLTTGIDSFSDSSDSFQIYTVLLTGGFQYMPFKKGLFLGIDAGVSLLIPDTNLSYIGSTEVGSGVAIDIGYMFDTLKFSKAGIIPGLGIKLIHSEMFRGSVNQICGYMNLGIR